MAAQLQQGSGGSMPTNPLNFLMAAADLHQQGALSSPDPAGKPMQTGKPIGTRSRARVGGKDKLQVVK